MSCGLFDGGDNTEESRSPLSEYVGFDRFDLNFDTRTSTEARITEAQNQREQIITDCMTAAGFDYQPTTPTTTAEGGEGEVLDPSSRDYAAIYGFGITTQAFSQTQVGQHLVGYPDPVEPADNPNLGIVNDLEPDQRVAYLQALTGTSGDGRPVTGEALALSARAGGCQGEALAHFEAQDRFYTEFADDLTVLRDEILADPRIVEHEQAVSECVTTDGLDYTPPTGLYQRWAPQLQEIRATLDTPVTVDDTIETEDNPRALPALPARAKAQLLSLQTEETALAVSVFNCGASPTETSDLYTQIAADHEQDFIQTHRQRLDQLNNT